MSKPATVGEIIKILEKLPKDYPVYFRPKYYCREHGAISWAHDVPVNTKSISVMHPENAPKNITFLC